MAKPIHFMRWAPADYLLDAFVAGCYRRADYRTLAFYSGFLFRSHLEGGSLPSEPSALADHLGMRTKDVQSGLAQCVKAHKLFVDNGRVYHKRVVKAVEDELAFRAEQSALGKKGAEQRWGTLLDKDRPPHKAPDSHPLPLPVPLPDPLPEPHPNDALTWDSPRGRFVKAVWSAYCEVTGKDPEVPGMTTADWHVACGWFDEGIPLAVVLRAVKDCLGSSPEKKPRALAYLMGAVKEASEYHKRAMA